MRQDQPDSVSTPAGGAGVGTRLHDSLRAAIVGSGGWLPFDRFMSLALYAPGLGYYARDARQFGPMPSSGSDFVTAPELSPLFGRALARPVAQALRAAGSAQLWEFGAGSGALAEQLLDALDADGAPPERYTIVDVSGALRARQRERLARHGERVRWADAWPDAIDGVVVGNEVLDAMPVKLLRSPDGRTWLERGVVLADGGDRPYAWADRPTALRPPHDGPYAPETVTEIHPQAEAFVASLAARLVRGAAIFIDYGFPRAEYYHPQRTGGTLMCHRAHRADADPLADVGEKDITAHVDFTGIALAAQDAGLDVVGYASQASFLIECGLVELLRDADHATRAHANRLLMEHEMGELFKVVTLARGLGDAYARDAIGYAHGDRTHTL